MVNSIWNKRISGIPGAVGNAMTITWSKLANWFSTHAMLGNIKRHGKNILVMRGCVFRYPDWIELDDFVIFG